MTRQATIGKVDQIPRGEGRKFRLGGVEIAVYHTQSGEVFASQSDCPHAGGPLADGLIGAANVICPLHERFFDLRTGACLGGDCAGLRIYPVALTAEGGIMLEIDEEGPTAAG
jgi:nitrite reductase (NADH) small subunit